MRGINVFEAPKDEGAVHGFKLSWGAAFTQQFQGLDHSNTAAPKVDEPASTRTSSCASAMASTTPTPTCT